MAPHPGFASAPPAGTTLCGFVPLLTHGACTGLQQAAEASTSAGPTEGSWTRGLPPMCPGAEHWGPLRVCPPVLCRPSSPGLGGGNRTLVSPSLSRALEKVASLGLRLWCGSACRWPEARPARESPASRGAEGLAALALAGSPRGPSLLPGSQMGLLAGTLPAAARLGDAPRPPGPPRGFGQEFRALAAPVLPGSRDEDREAAGEEPCASGGCCNPLRHTSGRWGYPLTGHRAWEHQSLGQGGTEPRGQAHRPRDLEGPTPWASVLSCLTGCAQSPTRHSLSTYCVRPAVPARYPVYLPFPWPPYPPPGPPLQSLCRPPQGRRVAPALQCVHCPGWCSSGASQPAWGAVPPGPSPESGRQPALAAPERGGWWTWR